MNMISQATPDQAVQIVDLIRSSILSCYVDHKNNQVIIDDWLANKTTDNVATWVKNNLSWVFGKDEQILGFILVSKSGDILLNYVHPENQRQGIGKALFEVIKRDPKLKKLSLTVISTITAKDFYEYLGFELLHEVYENDELIGFAMERPAEKKES